MFCPVGFRSAAELWDEFLAKRFEGIYVDAVQGYNHPDFQAFFTRGSPIDICEHVFLKSLSSVGVHICSPCGQVMRLHVQMDDAKSSLFSNARIYESALYSAAVKIEAKKDSGVDLLEIANFEAWHGEPSEHSKLAETYPYAHEVDELNKRKLGWGVPHHSLLNHILRRAFTIVETSPIWAVKTASSAQVAPLLAHYAGWAICLDEATYDTKWPNYLAGKVPLYPSDEIDGSTSQLGRPRMAIAHAAFAAMDFKKGDLTWPQVSAKIELETGERPSAKALRNWRDEAGKEG